MHSGWNELFLETKFSQNPAKSKQGVETEHHRSVAVLAKQQMQEIYNSLKNWDFSFPFPFKGT